MATTYTWATFKAAVLSFVTDRTPAEANFNAAIAEFVAARIARDILGDANGYAVRQNRFTAMRRALAGFQTTQNNATLQAAVKALLSDGASETTFTQAAALFCRAEIARLAGGDPATTRAEYAQLRLRMAGYQTTQSDATLKAAVKVLLSDGTSDTTYSQAAAAFVRAEMAKLGSGGDAAVSRAEYAQLRIRLAGFQTAQSDAALKAAVKVLIGDGATEQNFTQAAAAYVRAEMAKLGMGGDYAATRAEYAQLRLRMAGYQTVSSNLAVQTAVKMALSDGAQTNVQFAKACALYIRAETAMEVEARGEVDATAAVAIANKCRAEYLQLRARLCGFNHTLGGGLTAEVNKFLPVDSGRLNFTDYLPKLLAAAVEDIQSFGTWIDQQVVSAIVDINLLGPWIDQQVVTAKADLNQMGPWLDQQVVTAKADLNQFGPWLDQQILTAKDDLQALNDRIQKEIRAGVIDLQHYIRAYQKGHVEQLVAGDVTDEGYASSGEMPDGAQLREARILINPNNDEADAVQDTIEPDVGVVTALAAGDDPIWVQTLQINADTDNQEIVKVGYDVVEPIHNVPMVFPNLGGVFYDLRKFKIKTTAAGDKVHFLAITAEGDSELEYTCVQVPWWKSRDRMVIVKTCDPLIAVEPHGGSFLVTPKLLADQIALRLVWDGQKIEFEDDDDVPFDESAVRAVGSWVNAALAIEWGDALAQQQVLRAEYISARSRLYLKHKDRAEVLPNRR